MQEIQYSGDEVRTVIASTNHEAAVLFAPVAEAFPWALITDYKSTSTPSFHEILGEPVVTCVLPLQQAEFLLGSEYASVSRKFCMSSRTSYLRGYRLYDGPAPAWAPPSARILFYGVNMAEFGRPTPTGLDGFEDFYFSGDPGEVEAFFGLPERRGAHDTFYGATVVDGAVVRCKQYVYDEQTGYSDWDVLYWFLNKQREVK